MRRQRRRQIPTASRRISIAGLLLLGLILGLAGALYYAWVVAPVVYTDASPARFNEQHKTDYILLVSQSYAIEGDWEKAQRRLVALNDPAMAQTVTDLLELFVREQRPSPILRNLAVLAQQLGADTPAIALFAPTPLPGTQPEPTATPETFLPTVTPSPTLPPTETPRPTVTAVPTTPPDPTAQPTYRLLNQQRICQTDIPAPRIEVVTLDALLDPLPGVEVLVSWDAGNDHFFTGFKPTQGAGYGDFTMNPDQSYTIILADGSPEISGLRIEPCDNGQDGGWRLTFQNLILLPGE